MTACWKYCTKIRKELPGRVYSSLSYEAFRTLSGMRKGRWSSASMRAAISLRLRACSRANLRSWRRHGLNGCEFPPGGDAAGRETAEAVRKSDSKSVDFRSEAEDGHSLARLERIDRVGGLAVVERSGTTDCRPTPICCSSGAS